MTNQLKNLNDYKQ